MIRIKKQLTVANSFHTRCPLYPSVQTLNEAELQDQFNLGNNEL